MCACREERARVAADMKSLKSAHEKVVLEARQTQADRQQDIVRETPQSGDWVEVEKRVTSAGSVDIAAVSMTEIELKRRVDKLNSIITEVCIPIPTLISPYIVIVR